MKGPSGNLRLLEARSLEYRRSRAIVEGYRQKFGSGGRIRHMASKYVVIDPA